MKSPIFPTLCLFSLLLTALGCPPAGTSRKSEKLQVYTSFHPIYDFATKIAGEKADIRNLIPPGTDAHDWEPSIAEMMALENADILFYNGLGMEPWVEKIRGTLRNQDLQCVQVSDGATLLEGEGVVCTHGGHAHTHAAHDPHIWLSPQNAKKMGENVKTALTVADAKNAEYYTENYEKFAAECDRLDDDFRKTLTPLPKKDIFVSHAGFGYLCHRYGLTQHAVEGLTSHSDPSPARMAEIIKTAKKHDTRVIFFETLADPKIALEIAKTVNARTDVLNPYEGLSPEEIAAGEDYFSVMRKNLTALENALR